MPVALRLGVAKVKHLWLWYQQISYMLLEHVRSSVSTALKLYFLHSRPESSALKEKKKYLRCDDMM